MLAIKRLSGRPPARVKLMVQCSGDDFSSLLEGNADQIRPCPPKNIWLGLLSGY